MAKYFIDIVQDSPRTSLGIPVKTKNLLSRTNTPPTEPPFGIKLSAPHLAQTKSVCSAFSIRDPQQ